jgi:hypothetical protein
MGTEDSPGAKAVLGMVATVGGSLLLLLIKSGNGVAFDLFLILLTWVIFKFSGKFNPWVAAAVVTVTLIVWELTH